LHKILEICPNIKINLQLRRDNLEVMANPSNVESQ
jgi:hypothetical protein